MKTFAQACEQIAATTKKLEKVATVAEFVKSTSTAEASVAAIFLSGRPFPVWEETTLQVGGALLWRAVQKLSGKSEAELTASYRKLGDLGAVAGEVLPPGAGDPCRPTAAEVQSAFRKIAAARGPAAKAVLVKELLSQVSPLEAKYVIKIMTGDLRIGLKESLVEEAIAKAYGASLAEVQRTNMLLGDVGETLRLAAKGRLSEARMRLFHPLGFMLASPAASSEEAVSYFENALVEDKYDGIRAQVHVSGDEVRIFSRTRDEITESFPELPDALVGLPEDVILDGEIVAWSYGQEGSGRAQPFSALGRRLGRKKVSEKLMREVPVAYVVFDVLYAGGELLIDRPLSERAKLLDDLLASRSFGSRARTPGQQKKLALSSEDQVPNAQVIRAPVFHASSAAELDQLFDAAQARGNEGLMIKDPQSVYTPGRRGKSWLKLKRELATLDVVVTAVEYGHGKRIGVLSDYTFAVWKWIQASEHREGLLWPDRCRNRRNDQVVSGAQN
jgi:DNA ligase 1